MNILQHLSVSRYSHVLVSLNPPRVPSNALTQAIISYRHPLYTIAAMRAQRELPSVNGKRGVHFAGAWTGYGFHEDGFLSGVKAGMKCGGSVPWKVVETKEIQGRRGRTSVRVDLLKIVLFVVHFTMVFVQLVLSAPRRIPAWRSRRAEEARVKNEKKKRLEEKMRLTDPDDVLEGSSTMHTE
jgi:hypothetical protein